MGLCLKWIGLAGFLVAACVACDSRALDLVGYVPYYRMGATYNNSMLPTQLSMLNEVRYFGLTAASDGSILSSSGGSSLITDKGNIQTIASKISSLPPGQQPRLDL